MDSANGRSKPKGSRNIPVTTKRTIYVRSDNNPQLISNPIHESTSPLVDGNGPLNSGNRPPDSDATQTNPKQTDTQTDITATHTHSPTITQTDNIPSDTCLLYTSPSPRDLSTSRMPSSA